MCRIHSAVLISISSRGYCAIAPRSISSTISGDPDSPERRREDAILQFGHMDVLRLFDARAWQKFSKKFAGKARLILQLKFIFSRDLLRKILKRRAKKWVKIDCSNRSEMNNSSLLCVDLKIVK